LDTLSVIRTCLDPLAGRRILDVGCGNGQLASTLTSEGARVTGIDLDPTAIDYARKLTPLADFHIVSASQLPFAEGTFDAVVLVNSLHHIPCGLMIKALQEGIRVLGLGGYLIVIEPLPKGSFFEAFRAIEDETVVRLEAQEAISQFAGSAYLEERTIEYVRSESFSSFDAFVDRVTAAEKSRLDIVREKRSEILGAFENNATSFGNKAFVLEQPSKANFFRK
jgi:SAM-dependent methyltransferase